MIFRLFLLWFLFSSYHNKGNYWSQIFEYPAQKDNRGFVTEEKLQNMLKRARFSLQTKPLFSTPLQPRSMDSKVCYSCGKQGHIAAKCELKASRRTNTSNGLSPSQAPHSQNPLASVPKPASTSPSSFQVTYQPKNSQTRTFSSSSSSSTSSSSIHSSSSNTQYTTSEIGKKEKNSEAKNPYQIIDIGVNLGHPQLRNDLDKVIG